MKKIVALVLLFILIAGTAMAATGPFEIVVEGPGIFVGEWFEPTPAPIWPVIVAGVHLIAWIVWRIIESR